MYTQKNRRNLMIKNNVSGISLIELLIAITISTTVISLVFVAWQSVARHVTVNRRKTVLDVETQNLGKKIVTNLRKSTRIIDWHENKVVYVTPPPADTVTIEFFAEILTFNDSIHRFVSQTAFVSNLSFTQVSDNQAEGVTDMLLAINLTVEDDFFNKSEYNYQVKVKGPATEYESEDDGWNF